MSPPPRPVSAEFSVAAGTEDGAESDFASRQGWDVESFRAQLHYESHAPRHCVAEDLQPAPEVPTAMPTAKIELPSLHAYVEQVVELAPVADEDGARAQVPDADRPIVRPAPVPLPTYVPDPYDGHTAASYAAALKAGLIPGDDGPTAQETPKPAQIPDAPATAGAPPQPALLPAPAPAVAAPSSAVLAPAAPTLLAQAAETLAAQPVMAPPAVGRPACSPVDRPPLPSYVPDPYVGRGLAAFSTSGFSTSGFSTAAGWSYAASQARRKRVRRRRWATSAIALLVLATGAGLGLRVWHHSAHASSDWVLPVGSGVTPGAAATAPVGPGVAYRSATGHFVARFTTGPAVQNSTTSFEGQSLTAHAATVAVAATTVEMISVSPGVGRSSADDLLSAAVYSIARPGVRTLATQTSTTYAGRLARQATYTTEAGQVTALAVLFGTQRCYVLIAPSGATFTALRASFVALP